MFFHVPALAGVGGKPDSNLNHCLRALRRRLGATFTTTKVNLLLEESCGSSLLSLCGLAYGSANGSASSALSGSGVGKSSDGGSEECKKQTTDLFRIGGLH